MKVLLPAVLLLASFTASAQQPDTQQLSSQVERLAALVEQQQKQIEQLQKSQTVLLQELPSQKSPATTTTAAATPAAAETVGDPAPAQESTYSAPKERGFALGDRVRIGGDGSVRDETNHKKKAHNKPPPPPHRLPLPPPLLSPVPEHPPRLPAHIA